MKKHLGIFLINFFGWAFIAFGVVGLFLPFLQGILFLLIGVYILSLVSPTITKHLDRYAARHPRFRTLIYKLEKPGIWIKRKFNIL